MTTFKVSARVYAYVEAETKEEAIAKFEVYGPEEWTLDSATLRAVKNPDFDEADTFASYI